jgi:hypothetical protein
MFRFYLTPLDSEAECSRADAQYVSRVRQIHKSLRLAPATVVTRDFMMGAKRRYSFSRPAIATPGHQAIPVEGNGQHIIGTGAG